MSGLPPEIRLDIFLVPNHTSQADLTDDADKVFLMLKSEGIGAQLALFWAAWAYVLEMAESYPRAAEIIAEGRAR